MSKPPRANDRLSRTSSPVRVRRSLASPPAKLWETGPVSVGDLWALYSQYRYHDRLTPRAVLERSLFDVLVVRGSVAWQQEGFAVAAGFDTEANRLVDLRIPLIGDEQLGLTDSWLVARPDLAVALREVETPAESEGSAAGESGAAAQPGVPPASGEDKISGATSPAAKTRYFGTRVLNSARFARDFGGITKEVLEYLATHQATELEVSAEITARNADGFEPETTRTVRDNAATLKFSANGLEVDWPPL